MTRQFQVDYIEKEGEVRIFDPSTEYDLLIRTNRRIDNFNLHAVKFEFPFEQSNYHSWRTGNPIMKVTAREAEDYCLPLRSHFIKPALTYTEIGPGLGGFLSKVKEAGATPVGIDLADYQLMREMLLKAQTLQLETRFAERINILIERCDFYLDPLKVKLVNLPFEIATIREPNLKGSSDVVVTNFALRHYGDRSRESYTLGLVEELLKPNGKFFDSEGLIVTY